MSAFATIWTADPAPVTDAAEETALIAAAKVGDEAATLRLFAAYVPVLRKAVAKFRGVLDRDDAQQAAVIALMTAIKRFDPASSDRLSSTMRETLAECMADTTADTTGGFTIPSRTLKRALGILSHAEGDVDEAMRIAPQYDMRPDTLLAVLTSLSSVTSLERALEAKGDALYDTLGNLTSEQEITDVNDRIMCDLAFKAVAPVERDVCRMGYGFTDPEPLHDEEVGNRLGMGRVQTQRTRQRALGKMRTALGA
jgi:RNA polymerase sigma factor (sigma-70 family)